MVIDNGEDVLLNLKNPTKRVKDPDSNHALVIEFTEEEDLEIVIAKELSNKFNIANCDFEWDDEVLPLVHVNHVI